MAYCIKFTVRCGHCGHSNRPANNSKEGVKRVLTGQFTTCRGCGSTLSIFHIPARPLVVFIKRRLLETGTEIGDNIHIYNYKGRVPRTQAY